MPYQISSTRGTDLNIMTQNLDTISLMQQRVTKTVRRQVMKYNTTKEKATKSSINRKARKRLKTKTMTKVKVMISTS